MESIAVDPMDCLFCKIVAGKIPATKVFEDAHSIAFMDINPGTEGHCLVVPKTHAENIFDIAPDSLAETAKSVQKVAIACKKALGVEGVNIVQSSGAVAFQTVFHIHFHILPRRPGDTVRVPWVPEGADRGELERTADKIRQAL